MRTLSLLGLALCLTIAGCGAPVDEVDTSVTPSARRIAPYTPTAPAGLPVTVTPDADQTALRPLIARAARYGKRSNPFLLLADEVRFERDQTAARLFTEDGDFPLNYEPPVPGPPPPPEEAQPYRRLSGIVIGDAVIGILETQGEATILIRPGQRIPNSEWTVAALNEDRAILRRPGRRRPNEISVKLEAPPPGFGPATGGNTGGPTGPGGPGGGPRGPGGGPIGPTGAGSGGAGSQ